MGDGGGNYVGMTDDEKIIQQIMERPDDEPNMYFTIPPDMQKELDIIERKLKEYEGENSMLKLEIDGIDTSNYSDAYIEQRLREIDESLELYSIRKLLEKQELEGCTSAEEKKIEDTMAKAKAEAEKGMAKAKEAEKENQQESETTTSTTKSPRQDTENPK